MARSASTLATAISASGYCFASSVPCWAASKGGVYPASGSSPSSAIRSACSSSLPDGVKNPSANGTNGSG